MKIFQITSDSESEGSTIATNPIAKRKAEVLSSASPVAKKSKPSSKRASPVTVAPAEGSLWQQDRDERRPVVLCKEDSCRRLEKDDAEKTIPVVDMSVVYSERTAPSKKPSLKALLSSLEPVLKEKASRSDGKKKAPRIEAECLVYDNGAFTGVAIHWIWAKPTKDSSNGEERHIEWRQEWIGDLPEEYEGRTPKHFSFPVWLQVLREMTEESERND